MDFYYRDEWEGQYNSRNGGHLRLMTAFSQDQVRKIYVQQVMIAADDGNFLVQHLLYNGGAVYVAGGAKMARCVKDEIVEVLGKVLEGGEKKAKLFLKQLQRKGKFSVEAW
eukprot:CAMPEP_0194055134 /NCGR_PEP_ID=MMETSP0009_2-20130614/55706_1 /TAXON_ID=210454 /ORGANISM="Grammatophora oceanica, Strain CCMP 410" /LENGTH=110 /DNA_ID=CAMNT_0038703935 /DNA_START=1 /DNA_END=330 /DNA_ORIENTATION=+